MATSDTMSPVPAIYQAFAGFGQPPKYVRDDLYEPERLDYEEMLAGKPRDALVADDFGLVSWSPLGHLTPEATAYLLPRLIELAESGSKDRDGDPFLMRFINYISLGPAGDGFALLGAQHRRAVTTYLEHVAMRHMELVRSECWDDVLDDAIRRWSSAC